MNKILVNLLFTFSLCSAIAQHQIIPEPVQYAGTQEKFVLNRQINLYTTSTNEQVLKQLFLFANYLQSCGVTVDIKSVQKLDKNAHGIIVKIFDKSEATLGNEGYQLRVNKATITITANQSAGVFNAFQTLKQLLPSDFVKESTTTVSIAGCNITDYPRFAWRGLMLDVSRHFFGIDDVKAYIDQMSQYKFNVFHWHLTDDEGWRIEIKSLPLLTEVGAWRVQRFGKFGKERAIPKENEKATYGGFYTQEEIKDVIQYATERNITIVPEIDIPGHSMALLAAYPELSTKKEPKFVSPGARFSEWYGNGQFKMLIENAVNPADEKVYQLLDQVFGEIAELFPGKYIHMGGDECYHGYWDEDPKVQKFMKENQLEDSHALQSYFVTRVNKIIESKGKKMIGWDEILEGGLTDGAAVMSWRGMKGGIEAAQRRHQVVMSPTTFAYLDYTQGDYSVENKIYSDLSLEKAYSFEPVPEGVDAKYILGGQANLWAEMIPHIQYAFYMTYPRAFAISESVWTPASKKNWESFTYRTITHFARFDAQKTNIAKAIYEPIVEVYMADDKLMCQLKGVIPSYEIYYTIDNTYPVQFGQKYTAPFEVPAGNLSLRTQSFNNGQSMGRELIIPRSELEKRIKD